MEIYKYSQNWFLKSEIKNLLLNFINPTSKNIILEIGCFEGLSSVFFADNILFHPNSSLICVDPFLNDINNDHKDFLKNNEELSFDYNIKNCKNTNKIIINKITSDEFFETNNKMFNFIYIDGSHNTEYIKRDMENSFKFLTYKGIMWMDDYCINYNVALTMDAFLKKYYGKYEIIHSQYQLAIKKLI